MTTPRHHPNEELLLDYASGSLTEAEALLIATHLALCPNCRRKIAEMEAIGGALLEEVEPDPLSAGCLSATLARLDEPVPASGLSVPPIRSRSGPPVGGEVILPEPLRSYVGAPLADLSWQPVIAGLQQVDLGIGRAPIKTRLLRIKAGHAMPRHSHTGVEMTIVLAGGFRDDRDHYGRADVLVDDSSVDHRPVGDPGEDCLCLTVTNAPLRLTGRLGRLIAPFVRF